MPSWGIIIVDLNRVTSDIRVKPMLLAPTLPFIPFPSYHNADYELNDEADPLVWIHHV